MLIFEIIFHDEVQLLRNVSAQMLTFASYEAAKGHRQRPQRTELKNKKIASGNFYLKFLLNFKGKLPREGPGQPGALQRGSGRCLGRGPEEVGRQKKHTVSNGRTCCCTCC